MDQNSKQTIHFIKGRNTPTVELLAVPFGGPIRGKDTDGEYFSPRTDLCLDWFPTDRPLLYHHGMDDSVKTSVVGRVDSKTARKAIDGWWVEAQLQQSSKYFDSIKQLIDQGVLYGSSGAMGGLTQKARDGEILRWPWVEQSLTPTPANLFARVKLPDAQKHYKSAGLNADLLTELAQTWETGDVLETKVGRVLSAATEAKIRHALADLQAVLAALS